MKNTSIHERTNLQFRGELFNLFNRANFGAPASNVFDASGGRIGDAGRINNTDTTSRQIQFSLKVVF